MMECIFRNTSIKCIIIKEERGQKQERAYKEKTDAILVKEEGKSYSDLLKKVRERVVPNSRAANGIRTIRPAKEGGLVIVMDKLEEGLADEIRGRIKSEDQISVVIRKGRGEATAYIRDIDGVTTKEEVSEAVQRETGLNGDKFFVSELRPYFGGNQTATIKMDEEDMRKLIKKDNIKIGLSRCPIEERVNMTQCYRCWGYGHRREECREQEDFGRACRKCGKDGHIAKSCTEGVFCLSCKRPGHAAGSGACPDFRRALSRARLLKKKKRKSGH